MCVNPNRIHVEHVFYQDTSVLVSSSRFSVGGITFPIGQISSVAIVKLRNRRWLPLVIGFVGFALFNAHKASHLFERGLGVVLMLAAVYVLFFERKYAVQVFTSAGGRNLLVSKDKAYVRKVVAALNEAIVYRA